MADGAVRFISENISTGNQSTNLPAGNGSGPSPYGISGVAGNPCWN